MMPLNFVLVRHGESEGNLANRRSRRGDNSSYTQEFRDRPESQWRLTKKGISEAKIAGEWVRKEIRPTFDRYYVSEFFRAFETAYNLGFPPDAIWYPDYYLRERSWGEMGVMTQDEREEKFAAHLRQREVDSLFWTPPNGESLAQASLRTDRFLDTMHRECSKMSVCVVCHGETMWTGRIRIERLAHDTFRRLYLSKSPHNQIHNCQVIHYTRIDPDSGQVSEHLDWMRSVNPIDLSSSSNEWQKIERRRPTTAELKALFETEDPLVLD